MLKTVVFLWITVSSTLAVDFTCPTTKITTATLEGNLPRGTTIPTLIPLGTNCSYTFDIPNGYALLVQFSIDFQSDQDTVSVIDNTGKVRKFTHAKTIVSAPVWFAANTAQIKVIGVSGNTTFFASYQYKFLNGFAQVKKATGEYFALSLLSSKTYYTFTSAKGDNVVATYGRKGSNVTDFILDQIFVYDGDDISTSKMIGTLSDIGSSTDMISSETSLTLVNFYGTKSDSYVVGNDASTVSGYSKYSVIINSMHSGTTGTLGDMSGRVSGYTFICIGCNRFYLRKIQFDSLATIANMGYVKFQGQTPTHKRDQLITYEPMTYTQKQMPQLIPTDIFTLNVHLAKILFAFNTVNDDNVWKAPYDGRKGYIFSPNLWNANVNPNNFNYEFRNDTQLFNFAVTMNKTNFGLSSDQMTLQIGSRTGTPSVNNQYPRDQSSTGKVSSKGNYMKIGLTGSANDDIRLSFEMTIASSSTSIGFLTTLLLTLIYIF